MLQKLILSSIGLALLVSFAVAGVGGYDESIVGEHEASLIRGGCVKIVDVTQCSDNHTCCNVVNGKWTATGGGGTEWFTDNNDTACGNDGTCTCGYYNTSDTEDCG